MVAQSNPRPSRHAFTGLYLVVCLMVAVLLVPPQPVKAQGERCFSETGHCISGRIRTFWEHNGGLPVFGFPIAKQQAELIEGKSYQVQWFERNRLELHPENAAPYDVLLGRLGVDALVKAGLDWKTFQKTGSVTNCRFFVETGQSICGEILSAWRASGLEVDGQPGLSEADNLALFGLPISPPRNELTPNGVFEVQWFERARFERHPENLFPYNVLLGLLGNEIHGGPPKPPLISVSIIQPNQWSSVWEGPGGRYTVKNAWPFIRAKDQNNHTIAVNTVGDAGFYELHINIPLTGGGLDLRASAKESDGGAFTVVSTGYKFVRFDCSDMNTLPPNCV